MKNLPFPGTKLIKWFSSLIKPDIREERCEFSNRSSLWFSTFSVYKRMYKDSHTQRVRVKLRKEYSQLIICWEQQYYYFTSSSGYIHFNFIISKHSVRMHELHALQRRRKKMKLTSPQIVSSKSQSRRRHFRGMQLFTEQNVYSLVHERESDQSQCEARASCNLRRLKIYRKDYMTALA